MLRVYSFRTSKAVHDYGGDRGNTRDRITELEEKTKGKTLTDLDGLNARIAEKQEEEKEADREYSTEDSNLKNHQKILTKAKEYKEALASTDSVWQRLDTLGTLAVGSNSEGGRISHPFKVTEKTKNILYISVRKKGE